VGMGIDVITGAFSYTGQYVARRLLAANRLVRTLTGHPHRPHPFGDKIIALPYDFSEPDHLAKHLEGAETLYSTYWVRFPYGSLTFEKAVENSRILFQAAKKAGVRRIVHVSIANPSKTSPLKYYSGKAEVEEALLKTGISCAIFRPTVIFGKEDILINNIAWMVRHFPVFAVPGDGRYRLQPVYVEDFADALVAAGQTLENQIVNAVGPEVFSFDELVGLIARVLGKTPRLMHVPLALAYAATSFLGKFLGDVVLTKQEIQGLMAGLLVAEGPALGKTRLSGWIRENKSALGVSYRSEVKTHF
jgi:uncharacterized protein YbjT (DUF2867 family)